MRPKKKQKQVSVPDKGFLTVADVIEALQKYSPSARVRGYEGEISGIIVEDVGDRGCVLYNRGKIEHSK
jgi:hypothetical protein